MWNNFSSNEYGKTLNITSLISIKLAVNKIILSDISFFKIYLLLKGAPKVALLPLHYKMSDNWFLTTVS